MDAVLKLINEIEDILSIPPRDAPALMNASSKIISRWIDAGLPYPDKMIDQFVYIDDSIDRSIENFSNSPEELKRELGEAYEFHLKNFIKSLREIEKILRARTAEKERRSGSPRDCR